MMLKEGRFEAYAVSSESGTGDGDNYTVLSRDYEMSYYKDGKRYDLLEHLRKAADWCDGELTTLEAQLPYPQLPSNEGDEHEL